MQKTAKLKRYTGKPLQNWTHPNAKNGQVHPLKKGVNGNNISENGMKKCSNATVCLFSFCKQTKRAQLFKALAKPGAGCSKLTTSLVNVSLIFQTFMSEIRQ